MSLRRDVASTDNTPSRSESARLQNICLIVGRCCCGNLSTQFLLFIFEIFLVSDRPTRFRPVNREIVYTKRMWGETEAGDTQSERGNGGEGDLSRGGSTWES